MDDSFIYIPALGALFALFRLSEITPHASSLSRWIYWAGPPISFSVITLIGRWPLGLSLGFAVLVLLVSGILYLRYDRKKT